MLTDCCPRQKAWETIAIAEIVELLSPGLRNEQVFSDAF